MSADRPGYGFLDLVRVLITQPRKLATTLLIVVPFAVALIWVDDHLDGIARFVAGIVITAAGMLVYGPFVDRWFAPKRSAAAPQAAGVTPSSPPSE